MQKQHSGMSEEHIAVLSKHCRVCGSHFKNKKRVDLLEVFGIDVNEDQDEIHIATLDVSYQSSRKRQNGIQPQESHCNMVGTH